MPLRFSAKIRRYRVHVRNINPRVGVPGEGTVSVPNMWIGNHTEDSLVTGGYRLIATDMTSSGEDMVTPWVTTPLEANTGYIIAYQWSSTAPTHAVVGGCWSTVTQEGVSSNASTATRETAAPLDVWIEAEVDSDTPVVAVFGDSLSSGVGATLPVYDSWASVWCRNTHALPVHYSASGDSMAGWADTSAYKWQRWQGLSRPDVAMFAMGSNDVFGGASLSTMKARRAAAMEQVRSLVSPVIYSTTITPRTGISGATEQARRDYNSWLKALPDAGRDVFDFTTPISSDDENILPAYDVDGAHLNTSGYALLAGAITRPIVATPDAATYASGRRDIATGDAGITSGTVVAQRVGSLVEVAFTNVKPAANASSSYTLETLLPVGFRPAGNAYFILSASLSTAETRTAVVFATNGGIRIYGAPQTTDTLSGTGVWLTADAPPLTLPGAAV